ncbi:MAG: helix-turn-helix domain-containing protein [Natronomonas sp.]
MTDTQREALVLAHERGHFDVPRDTSLEETAEGLGITQQSLSSGPNAAIDGSSRGRSWTSLPDRIDRLPFRVVRVPSSVRNPSIQI